MGCRQRDLSDRANLLLDWASTGRLREASLPGRPHSIRDPNWPGGRQCSGKAGPANEQLCSFSKGALDLCSPRDRAGDRDDGGRSQWRSPSGRNPGVVSLLRIRYDPATLSLADTGKAP